MSKQKLKTTSMIAGFRILSSVFGFIIPLYLSRHISIEDYGTYKALILIQSTAMFVLPLGIDSALLVFLQKDRNYHHMYGLNILVFTFITGALCTSIFIIFIQPISGLLNIKGLIDLKESFSVFLMTSLMTNHIYIYFIFKEKIKTAISIELISQLCKAFLTIFGFYYIQTLDGVFWLLGIFFGFQLVLITLYHIIGISRLKQKKQDVILQFSSQIGHGLPVGLSNIALYMAELDKLVISSLFGARSFAIYSTGCFKLPFTHSIESTMLDMMGMAMVKNYESKQLEKIKQLWKDYSRQILSIQIPIGIFFSIFSEAVITLIFSSTYTESAAIFSIFMLMQTFNSSQPDMLFRVMQATKRLMNFQIIYVCASFSVISLGAIYFGVTGAILAKFVVNFCVLALKINWYRKRLILPVKELYDWRPIIQIIGICLTAALIAKHLTDAWVDSPFAKLGIGGISYLALIYVMAFRMHALDSKEKDFIETWLLTQYQRIKNGALVR